LMAYGASKSLTKKKPTARGVPSAGLSTALSPTESHGQGIHFCPNCGKEVADGAKFCVSCGSSLPQVADHGTPVPTLPLNTSQTGKGSTLLILWLVGLTGLVILYVSSYVTLSVTEYWVGFALAVAVTLIATESIYRDAKKVNQLKGRRVLDPTLWSLVTFLAFEIALPWYVFSRRKNALAS
jgi:hypothetical protein